jgi:hypothetical protein
MYRDTIALGIDISQESIRGYRDMDRDTIEYKIEL